MWVAEFKVWHEGSPLLPLSATHDIHLSSLYLNTFSERGKTKIMRLAVIWGKEREKVFELLAKEKRIEIFFREGNQFVFTQDAIDSFHSMVSDRRVFLIGPVLEEKGFQWWQVGSNEKKNLEQFYRKIKALAPFATIEIVSIKEKNVGIVPFGRLPDLALQDIEWWKTALREGYYAYPRRIALQDLAKKIGVPYSTLKDHLRKTESRLMAQLGQSL